MISDGNSFYYFPGNQLTKFIAVSTPKFQWRNVRHSPSPRMDAPVKNRQTDGRNCCISIVRCIHVWMLQNLTSKILCIFAPYAPCLSTPLLMQPLRHMTFTAVYSVSNALDFVIWGRPICNELKLLFPGQTVHTPVTLAMHDTHTNITTYTNTVVKSDTVQ